MIRSLTLALALAAAPAWAAGPGFSIAGAHPVGVTGFPALARRPACGASGPAAIDVTFTDPDGIAYAAVSVGAARTRPAVSERTETWLWLPDYARPDRGYRWRYEDTEGRLLTRRTVPVRLDLIPGAGPIPVEVMAKDGRGAMTIRRFAMVPDACRYARNHPQVAP